MIYNGRDQKHSNFRGMKREEKFPHFTMTKNIFNPNISLTRVVIYRKSKNLDILILSLLYNNTLYQCLYIVKLIK